ncbi:hypothetical protein SUSAZ_02370 [Sulfolobus acidocaldarius SUSAZ]|nr:hypothetical protein SUSAZ_02370 [Sulfolobus acidocaldarius SUSAZ]
MVKRAEERKKSKKVVPLSEELIDTLRSELLRLMIIRSTSLDGNFRAEDRWKEGLEEILWNVVDILKISKDAEVFNFISLVYFSYTSENAPGGNIPIPLTSVNELLKSNQQLRDYIHQSIKISILNFSRILKNMNYVIETEKDLETIIKFGPYISRLNPIVIVSKNGSNFDLAISIQGATKDLNDILLDALESFFYQLNFEIIGKSASEQLIKIVVKRI